MMNTFTNTPRFVINRSILYWEPSRVVFYDASTGSYRELHKPITEISALLWCSQNGVEFRCLNPSYVSAADVFRNARRDFAPLEG